MVVDEELALFGIAVGCGDGALVGKVAVASAVGVVYALALVDEGGHDSAVLKGDADGETHGLPQVAMVYLVACIAVLIALAMYPVGENICGDGLLAEGLQMGGIAPCMYLDGVFEHVHLGMGEEIAHVVDERERVDVVIRVDEGEVCTACHPYSLVAC